MHTRSEIAKRSEQIPEKQYVRSSSLLLCRHVSIVRFAFRSESARGLRKNGMSETEETYWEIKKLYQHFENKRKQWESPMKDVVETSINYIW